MAQEDQAGLEAQEPQASLAGREVLLFLASLHQGTQGALGGPVLLWVLESQVVQWGH